MGNWLSLFPKGKRISLWDMPPVGRGYGLPSFFPFWGPIRPKSRLEGLSVAASPSAKVKGRTVICESGCGWCHPPWLSAVAPGPPRNPQPTQWAPGKSPLHNTRPSVPSPVGPQTLLARDCPGAFSLAPDGLRQIPNSPPWQQVEGSLKSSFSNWSDSYELEGALWFILRADD